MTPAHYRHAWRRAVRRRCLHALDGLESGALRPVPQDHAQATYAPKLRKEDGIIDWSQSADDLAHLIRGVTPWPGAVTTHRGKPLRIWRATSMPNVRLGEAGAGRQHRCTWHPS